MKCLTSCFRAFRAFRDHDDGVTAVEFALVALPFLVMVLGVVETGRAFATYGSMSMAADTAARDVLICRVNPEENSLEEMTAYFQDELLDNPPLGPASNLQIIEGGGNLQVVLSHPHHLFIPGLQNHAITLSVRRPLTDSC